MAIRQALCKSYKAEILRGLHSDIAIYKMALYTSEADLDENTTAYTLLGEAKSGTGYAAGGKDLTGFSVQMHSGVAVLDFDDAVWGPGATIKASGGLIYNETMLNKSVAVLAFGSSYACINGELRVEFPEPTKTEALIRVI